MSKLVIGQKVLVHFPNSEAAQSKAIHLIDENQTVHGEVVYVHESGNVNVVTLDHVGSVIPLLDVQTTKPKDEDVIYVSAVK